MSSFKISSSNIIIVPVKKICYVRNIKTALEIFVLLALSNNYNTGEPAQMHILVTAIGAQNMDVY